MTKSAVTPLVTDFASEVSQRLERLVALATDGGFDAAIELMSSTIEAGAVIQAFGTGHSEAFAMEILDPSERGTMVGLRSTAQQIFSGLGAFAGSRLMAGGDYVTPFILMATLYAASSILFWIWFRPLERETLAASAVPAGAGSAAGGD